MGEKKSDRSELEISGGVKGVVFRILRNEFGGFEFEKKVKKKALAEAQRRQENI